MPRIGQLILFHSYPGWGDWNMYWDGAISTRPDYSDDEGRTHGEGTNK